MEYLHIILNNALYFSLLLIILSSIISVFLVGRKKDRCLKDLNGYMCSLYLKTGKEIYGYLRVFGTGLEMEYSETHQDTQGHLENSFIFYMSEFQDLMTIKRFHQKLSAEDRKKRTKDIRAAYYPGALRITRRRIRNFLSTFQDGITRSLNTLIGIAAAKKPKSNISEKQKDLTGLGAQVVSAVSHAYDPILERYIGHYVVLEMVENGVLEEFCGILKDYTQDFIEILNLVELEKLQFEVGSQSSEYESWLKIFEDDRQIRIENESDWPIHIIRITSGDKEIRKNHLMPEKSSISTDIPSGSESGIGHASIVIELFAPRIYDMVVPRALSLIRHGCPREKHSLETFLGTSASQSLQKALQSHFVLKVNAQIPSNPE
ncbi:hypothetical protein JW823_00220 [bacterium]|nr:hypothetical protein [candidate division CSSED10-310 bacterium]